ncbi:MAG: AtpZ/AtpI family protein [Thiomicrorhabdus sp.]|nr:AtpZ/AtpI family protein [Thiomicrorhabdus sp.]
MDDAHSEHKRIGGKAKNRTDEFQQERERNHAGKHLQQQLERQAKRIQKAERERPTLMAQTVYLGMVGLLFVLPVIAGAYLGLWLDSQQVMDYSISWTISLIFVGVFVGVMNVYLFFKKA